MADKPSRQHGQGSSAGGGALNHEFTCGEDVEIIQPANIYGCTIGSHVRIGPFVEIQQDCVIGDNVKIGSHTFLCAGTRVGDGCFIGHGVMTCNDIWPRATVQGRLKGPLDWANYPPVIHNGASIGTGAVILPGIDIGVDAMIGAGAVVIGNVGRREIAVGNPAKIVGVVNAYDRPGRPLTRYTVGPGVRQDVCRVCGGFIYFVDGAIVNSDGQLHSKSCRNDVHRRRSIEETMTRIREKGVDGV